MNTKTRLRRIGPTSLAKMMGATYALIGVIVGALVSVISMVGTALAAPNTHTFDGFAGMLLGIGAIIFIPLFYGILGLIVGLIGAGIYNLLAGKLGGVELEMELPAHVTF